MKAAYAMLFCSQVALSSALCLMTPVSWAANDTPENGNGGINGSTNAEKESRRLLEDPLTGIVINRTVTVLGKDFYHYFVTAWRQKDGDNRYSLTVYERPSARWGSEIWIEYQRNQMFRIFLSPARQAARKVSEEAAEIVHRNIIESEIRKALTQSQDLADEEL